MLGRPKVFFEKLSSLLHFFSLSSLSLIIFKASVSEFFLTIDCNVRGLTGVDLVADVNAAEEGIE